MPPRRGGIFAARVEIRKCGLRRPPIPPNLKNRWVGRESSRFARYGATRFLQSRLLAPRYCYTQSSTREPRPLQPQLESLLTDLHPTQTTRLLLHCVNSLRVAGAYQANLGPATARRETLNTRL